MAFDRQGNLPALATMSKVELKDLLSRQEKILDNKKFVRTLPDKGKKIETFASKLRETIKEKEDIERTAQLFEKMDLGASCMTEEGVVERIPNIVTSAYTQGRDDGHTNKQTNSTPNVFLKTGINVKKKEPFLPYKSLKSTSIPKDLVKPNISVARNVPCTAEPKPSDVSAVTLPPLKHPGTKTVELEESTQLLELQKKKVDELLAEQAAVKLAERMHIKLEGYVPASPDMRYREPNEEQDEDDEESSDDEDDGDNDNEHDDDEND